MDGLPEVPDHGADLEWLDPLGDGLVVVELVLVFELGVGIAALVIAADLALRVSLGYPHAELFDMGAEAVVRELVVSFDVPGRADGFVARGGEASHWGQCFTVQTAGSVDVATAAADADLRGLGVVC